MPLILILIRCENEETADAVKQAMKSQWSEFVFPGRKAKVKVKDDIISAEVEKCYFVSKLSFDYTITQLQG